MAEKLSPDLIVLDLNMKGSSGVEILTTLKERDPSQRVVILTVSDSGEDFFSCIRAGADGYFLKDMEPEKVLYCVRESLEGLLTVDPAMVRYLTDLLRGKAPKVEETVSLTDREEDVLSCIARGMTNKMIGRELKISDGTVKGHVKHRKSNGGVQRFSQVGWKSTAECNGIRELDCETDGSSRCESRT